MKYHQFYESGLTVPQVVFGTSCLGNLYEELRAATKLEISREWFAHLQPPVVIDTAWKYGAGLALEFISRNLQEVSLVQEPHDQFKLKVPQASGLVRTGETNQYNNIILESA